ncbi:7161_t:CDS:10 [Funneliformis caledonium]|uniref:7161_t:CDS:1 n=1 Tax=Funneliformis caledonium TaxID=1117310 RepID=A0A9N9HIL4_9GLOM|nr:7161_t:CDS:10 [Funneliformis caledonium]
MGVFKTTTRTAVTEWIERMTSERYKEDDFNDMFELCEVINIQSTGPKEASKALKRALKYGNIHSQVLKSLTENCGDKFVAQISTHKFTDRLRSMALSPYTDSKVQKKLLSLFAEWSTEFKNRSGYETLANLNDSVNFRSNLNNFVHASNTRRGPASKSTNSSSPSIVNKERSKSESSGGQSKKGQQSEKRPVTYSSEKINEAIGLATQNATNLINALTFLNPGSDLEKDYELQELFRKCKSSSEILIKIIPTVTDGNKLGPLLQSNDQVQGSLSIYSEYCKKDNEVNNITSGVKSIKLQKQKENVFDHKKKNQAEGNLIDFDSFSSNKNSSYKIENSAYTDPFADPFADPETPSKTQEPETVNEPKRRLEW